MRFKGTFCTRSRVSATAGAAGWEDGPGATGGIGFPINAPRPRPKADFDIGAGCRRAGDLSILRFRIGTRIAPGINACDPLSAVHGLEIPSGVKHPGFES